MSDDILVVEPPSSQPSPFARALLTFTSPSRAFQGDRLSASWWVPYLLFVLVGFGLAATIGKTVGWEVVARNNLAASPKQQARFEQSPPAQQEQQLALIGRFTRTSVYAGYLIGPLIFGAIAAGLLLATFNFGLGAGARFGPLFAVYLFSTLPQLLKLLLAGLMLLVGVNRESYLLSNPLGSNPAYYLQGSATPHWLLGMLNWFDLFLVWQVALLVIGCAIVARVSRGKSSTVILSWVVLLILITGAISAMS